MASETFFDRGDRVMLAAWWVKGEKHEKELLKLTGTVGDCDDSARECCYYEVKWDATDEELEVLGMNHDGCPVQTDAITYLKKRKEKQRKKPLAIGDSVVFPRDYALWQWIERDGAIVYPYSGDTGLARLQAGNVGKITAAAKLTQTGERVLRLEIDGLPPMCLSPGRDSLGYRRVT
jgi:hypothetical protein